MPSWALVLFLGQAAGQGCMKSLPSGQGESTWCSMRSVKRAHAEINGQHALPRPLQHADSGTGALV